MSGTHPDANAAPAASARDKIAWVARNLGVSIGDSAVMRGSSSGSGSSLVALQKSRLAWDATRKAIQAQIQALERAIIDAVDKHNADEGSEDEYDEGELVKGLPKLYEVLNTFDTRLIDKLDDALNASGDQRLTLQQEASGIVSEYRASLAADTTLPLIDKSGFLPNAIRPILDKTLTVLATQL